MVVGRLLSRSRVSDNFPRTGGGAARVVVVVVVDTVHYFMD